MTPCWLFVRTLTLLQVLVVEAVRETAKVSQTENHHAPLCAPELVSEACLELSHDGTAVSAASLGQAFAASETSTLALWQELNLSQSTTCEAVCSAVQANLEAKGTAPPSSDLGCLLEDGDISCDVDLEPRRLNLRIGSHAADMPNLHDSAVMKSGEEQKMARVQEALVSETARLKKGLPGSGQVSVKRTADSIDYDIAEMVEQVAKAFRIFPVKTISITDVGPEHTPLESARGSRKHFCDKFQGAPEKCAEHKACQVTATGCERKFKPSWSNKGWMHDVKQRSMEAEAYVETAKRQFARFLTASHMDRWFGENASRDGATRKEVLRILNSISRMLGKVQYKFNPPECEPNVYAFVYPHSGPGLTLNKRGDYIFYLCPLYVASPISEQIETLTHEASHHALAYTDDVCMDEFTRGVNAPERDEFVEWPLHDLPHPIVPGSEIDVLFNNEMYPAYVHVVKESTAVIQLDPRYDCRNPAYGRSDCEWLAANSPNKALRNADNMCYYIQDITDAA
eukprot:TRINITY_DN3624_c0_g1_i2.p1 TRINITY_DN3624_c0_g1~~TRINITY_DN3624_c0_g1_i2.p1  ORF type:complete len:512 (+),score=68.78 TRINITY_DN3624_c0_g1_i2:66-1601(+)